MMVVMIYGYNDSSKGGDCFCWYMVIIMLDKTTINTFFSSMNLKKLIFMLLILFGVTFTLQTAGIC